MYNGSIGNVPQPANIMLAGGLSPYGTMAQGGNLDEWEETDFDLVNDSPTSNRGFRGGEWWDADVFLRTDYRNSWAPSGDINTGFRVASMPIPEPGTLLLGMVAGVVCLLPRRR